MFRHLLFFCAKKGGLPGRNRRKMKHCWVKVRQKTRNKKGKKIMEIKKIEALTQKEVEELRTAGKAELLKIKEHDCYLVDLGGYFGYSVLGFNNNRHMHYANDYQLHHGSKSLTELRGWYIKTLNNKLFTEEELMGEVKSYYEYQKKSYYIRNYWIMQFERESVFCIGEADKKLKKAEKNWFYCADCFCWVKEEKVVDMARKFIGHIEKSFRKIRENEDVFRKMVAYELANHEAGYTCDYREALGSLGLRFSDLTDNQKRIVKEELNKQIDRAS